MTFAEPSQHYWEHWALSLTASDSARKSEARTDLDHTVLVLWRQAFRKPKSAPQTPCESGINKN